MASANTKLLMIGAITVAIGLVPLMVSGWFIFYTLPLILAGIGMMAFAGLRSAVAFGGIEGSRATILVGGLMMVQYPIVGVLHTEFLFHALSFGLAFAGFVACLTVVIPLLRELATAPPRNR
jgi:hypothetical protein